jgi:O-antigen/teichoic acid export membrane protein
MQERSASRARLARVGREVFWVGVGQALSAIGALVGLRLLTGVLDPEQYGGVALGLSIAAFVQLALLQPLYEASLRFFSVAEEAGQMAPFLAAVRRLTLAVSGAVLVGSLLIIGALSAMGQGQWVFLTLTSAVFSITSGLNVAMNGIQNAARHRAVVAWHDTLSQWLRFLLAVLFVGWFGARSQIAMLGYAAASFVVLGSQYSFLIRTRQVADIRTVRISVEAVADWTRRLSDYAWPVAAWGLFMGTHLISARWSLQLLHTPASVGFYAVLYQLGFYPVVMVTTLWMLVIQPVMFGRAGAGTDPARTARGRRLGVALAGATLLLTGGTALLAAAFSDQIFRVLAAPEYGPVSYLLPIMVIGSGLFAGGQVLSLVGMVNPDTTRLMAPKIGASVIGTLANVLAAWRYGVEGVVYASVLYGLLYLTWTAMVIRTGHVEQSHGD